MKKSTSTTDRRLFLRQMGICIAGISAYSIFPAELTARELPRHNLPRSSPEAQGISSADILRFVENAEKSNAGLHSFMVVRHGYVVAEGWWAPYAAGLTDWLYSLSKNFTSTAIGLAIQEGKLQLQDKVISFFPDEKPRVMDPRLSALCVRDLLTMSSGHAQDTLFPLLMAKDGNWVKAYFAVPFMYEPGTHFLYNSGNTYMLSAILQKITGQTMMEYLQPRLFSPLHIEDAKWDTDPRGVNVGFAGLHLKTEDLAKFGQLYLQKGVWNGKRILSEAWIKEATSFQIRNDETGTPTKKEDDDIKQGYGYQFWLSRPVAQGAYRAEGAFCQYSIVMPAQDAVVAITAEGISTKRVMDLTWDILLPAMQPGKLPANRPGHKALQEKLSSLKLAAPGHLPEQPVAATLTGKTFKMAENPMQVDTVSFNFNKEASVFTLRDNKGAYSISCGHGDWIIGETNMPGSPTNPLAGIALTQKVWKLAASGTWTDEKTFVMTWRFFETPHFDIVTCIFENGTVRIEYANSVTRILKMYKDPRPALNGSLIS